MGASALLAVALGATLALSPAIALAETAADQPLDSPEQQVAVLDVEAKDPVAPAWKQGWVLADDGSWYWGLSDGTFAKDEWVYTGGSWYLMDADGAMMTGLVQKDGAWYYLTSSGAMATGWAQDADGSWCLTSQSGALLTGWQKVGGTWYWLDPSSYEMATGVIDLNDGRYFLLSSGAMATGWVQDSDGSWYLASQSGALLSGWQKSNGSWYWLDPQTGRMTTGFLDLDGNRYFLKFSGAMATGWAQDADGTWYLASTDASDGRLQTGWQKSNGSWYWLDPATAKMATGWLEQGGSTYNLSAPNGNMLVSAWVDDENGHHWLGSDGVLVATVSGNRIVYADAGHAPASGLTTIGDAVYYADPETGLLKGGEVTCEDGKVREFDEFTYAAVSKWYTDQDGNWHYLKNGLDASGWVLINTTWYYLDPSTGVMLTGWQKVDDSWYWLESWGGMRTGWLYDGGSWYYLSGSGAMVTGWYEVSEHIYQFASNGRMYEPQMVPATDAQQRVVAAAQRVPSPGGGLCSEWVSMVFAEAGYRYVYADACDDYWWFCSNGNISDLKVGMIIAVPSHTHSYLASIYGHVCIYIGDGKVMDNAGYGEIRVKDLYEWLAYYDTTYQPLWGWYDSAPLC